MQPVRWKLTAQVVGLVAALVSGALAGTAWSAANTEDPGGAALVGCTGLAQRVFFDSVSEAASLDEAVQRVLQDLGVPADGLQAGSVTRVIAEGADSVEVETSDVNTYGGYTVLLAKTDSGGFSPVMATQCQAKT